MPVSSSNPLRNLSSYLSLIRFSHSVFALPFALIALLVATGGRPSLELLGLVVLAVVFARSAAMAYNRWADRKIDAENPRTAGREIPRGVISSRAALALAIGCAVGFLVVCRLLSPLCFWFGIPLLLVLLGYSHAKRFTSLSHLWLGLALGLSPVAAWVAATGLSSELWAAVALGVGVMLWVAGFDVLYACQDEEFDRQRGLYSIPARLGRRRALSLSAAMHVGAVLGFGAFGVLGGLGLGYGAGVAVAAALLSWEHWLLRPGDLDRINMAFFTANGLVSIAMLAATCVDLYLIS